MTPRLIHDCPYCGRTKFADQVLPCCVDEEFERLSPESKEQVQRAMRNYERRERREKFGDPEKFDAGLGSYLTVGEEFGS